MAGDEKVDAESSKYLSVEDFPKICRVCLKEGTLKPLVGSELQEEYVAITLLEINPEDSWPKKICDACKFELVQASNFVKACQDAAAILQEIEDSSSSTGDHNENALIDEKEHTAIASHHALATQQDIELEIPRIELIKTERPDVVEVVWKEDESQDEEILLGEEDAIIEELEIESDHRIEEEIIVEEDHGVYGEEEDDDDDDEDDDDEYYLSELGDEFDEVSFKASTTTARQNRSIAALVASGVKKLVTCPNCGDVVDDLLKHNAQSKDCQPKKIQCAVCKVVYTSKSAMLKHMRVHGLRSEFKCHVCTKTFKLEQSLKRHLDVHANPKRFKCRYCDKAYTTALVRDDHMNSHTGARPFACSHCDECFATRPARFRHIKRVHDINEADEKSGDSTAAGHSSSPEGLSLCFVCSATFKDQDTLKDHLEIVHSIGCGNNVTIIESQTSGVSESPRQPKRGPRAISRGSFPCPYCNKVFAFNSAMKNHLLVHTGQRPYTCQLCPKSFSQKPHLNTHMLTHTGEKLNECRICGKAFALKGNLVVHIRTHTGETPYTCHVCHKGFHDSSSRKKHVRTKHGEHEVHNISYARTESSEQDAAANNNNNNVDGVQMEGQIIEEYLLE